MKIAFLGTRGIPNNYGGFEQFAEYLSVGLVKLGHQVTVYNPHFHPYKENGYNGVNIQRMYSPEKWIGAAANYIYDYLCLRDALKNKYDIIYEAGYASVSFFYLILPIWKSKVVTNMDGLEWKRAKWNFLIKQLTLCAERVAVNRSHYLIADNIGIQEYYKEKFNKESFYLVYGATIASHFDQSILESYKLNPYCYFLVVARIEPENNIEVMILAYLNSKTEGPLLIVGNYSNNKYGKYLYKKYGNKVMFLGGLYDKEKLDSLRYFAKAYLHGHSVGGTNPSLLEAMASSSLIIAHQNSFNYSVLGDDAFYFNDSERLTVILNFLDLTKRSTFINNNLKKIKENYEWPKIVLDHEKIFKSLSK